MKIDRDGGKQDTIKTSFRLVGKDITIESSRGAQGVPILHRLRHPDHYSGPPAFDSVVSFGRLFVERGMRNQHVPLKEQWSKNNPPPEGIKILEFEDETIKFDVETIAAIAKEDFYDSPLMCRAYHFLNKQVLQAAVEASGVDLESSCFMGLVRAGVVAGEVLGIPVENQILVQTKRLVEGESDEGGDGDVSIGITVMDKARLAEIDGKDLIIADPAGATYGSIVANVVNLVNRGIRPRKVLIFNTVASHRGSEFALEAIRDLALEVEIFAGGYSSGMNETYYLETPERTPSVRDAGDALDRFLPPDLRLRN